MVLSGLDSSSETSSISDPEKGDPTASRATTESVPVDLLEVGDVVRVPHGSSPPADGMIVLGESGIFDESSLTGESKPVKKESGDQVYVGTINSGDVVHMRVVEIGGSTMCVSWFCLSYYRSRLHRLDKVLDVIREGRTRRAPMERIADVVTSFFVPVVTLLAIMTWIIWLSLGETGRLPADFLDNAVGGWRKCNL